MGKVFKATKKLLPYMVLAIALKASGAIVEIAIPSLLSRLIDEGIAMKDFACIKQLTILMAIFALVACLFNVIAHIFSAKYSQGAANILRKQVFHRIQTLYIEDVDSYSVQSLVTRTTNDIEIIQRMLEWITRPLVRGPVMIVGGIIFSLLTNAKLTLIIFIGMLLVMAISFLVLKLVNPIFRKVQTSVDALTRIIRENIEGIRIVKGLNKLHHETERFDKTSIELKQNVTKAGTIHGVINPLVPLVSSVTLALFLLYSGKLKMEDAVTVGEISAIVQYISTIIGSTNMIPRMFMMLGKANVSASRVFAVVDQEKRQQYGSEETREIKEGNSEVNREEENKTIPILTFDHVSFRYPGARKNSLDDISFTLNAHQTLGVIGATGSGKTTLLNVLLLFYDTYEGNIFIKGKELRTYTKKELRSLLTAAPQNVSVLKESIKENIILDQVYDPERMDKAIRTAELQSFIESLQEGIDYELSQGGTNLSGGQKQRLSIARTLYRESEIAVFDDISSGLDYHTDKLVRDNLDREYPTLTKVIISQRVTSVMHASSILVIDHGRIIAQGTHASLLRSSPEYQAINESQRLEEEKA